MPGHVYLPLCKTVNKRGARKSKLTRMEVDRSKRLKGHFGCDPAGQFVAMWSVPPPQQLVSAGQVTSICPLIRPHTYSMLTKYAKYEDYIQMKLYLTVFECQTICIFLMSSCYFYLFFFLHVLSIYLN